MQAKVTEWCSEIDRMQQEAEGRATADVWRDHGNMQLCTEDTGK